MRSRRPNRVAVMVRRGVALDAPLTARFELIDVGRRCLRRADEAAHRLETTLRLSER